MQLSRKYTDPASAGFLLVVHRCPPAIRGRKDDLAPHQLVLARRAVLKINPDAARRSAIKVLAGLGWSPASDDIGRGIYGEALRESQRLESVTHGALDAELAAITRS